MTFSPKKPLVCIIILLMVMAIFLMGGCGNTAQPKKFVIGFSQSGEADQWRKSMLKEMQRELSFHPEMQMIYRESHDNSQMQIAQVRELMNQHIDVLIVSASEAAPLTPIVEKVFNSGIPVIVIDRKIASEKYTNHIGADNKQIGTMAAEYMNRILKGKGRVLEITGKPSSSPASDRSSGFEGALKGYPGLHIIRKVDGEWLESEAQRQLMRLPGLLDSVDGVFAHNDVMGLGAYKAMLKLNKRKLPIIGVDALPHPALGLQLIKEGKLVASMLYPTGGKEAIRNAALLEQRKALPRQTTLQTMVVDGDNVETMIMQTDKISGQQKDIEQQQVMLEEQQKIYHSQQSFIYLLVSLMVLFLVASILLFYSRRINRSINRELTQRNKDISLQSEELVRMSQRANEANDAKLNFFTKISHEFRTPLTLIISPTEELLSKARLTPEFRTSLNYIKKNAFRLLRLVNQLMDLRQLEFGKIKLHVFENDIVAFCNEIILSFASIANKRHIDCRLITPHRSYLVWFDPEIMEKVLFNLLSNAFKSTPDGGSITLDLEVLKSENQLQLCVKDTGVGMSKEEQVRIFDLFFRGNNEIVHSSGVGLNLTKELVEIHHGEITLHSKKNEGTVFIVALPLNGTAYSPAEKVKPGLYHDEIKDLEQLYTTELLPEDNSVEGVAPNIGSEKETLLVIEDNKELLQLLKGLLEQDYEVITVEEGKTGLDKAFDIMPDLVLCDIMLPEMDGLSVCSQLKKDIRTSHIPIILLTAKASESQCVEGLKSNANAYIAKPFNTAVLKQTIETLLYNYNRVKAHFTSIGYLPGKDTKVQGRADVLGTPLSNVSPNKKVDRRFVAEFNSIIENNLHDDAFSVESICRMMNVSKIQLYRKVKALLKVNVNEYLMNARIQKARYYLMNEDLPIAEVAFKVGFSSAAYFSTVFKAKTGVTAKELRKSKNMG